METVPEVINYQSSSLSLVAERQRSRWSQREDGPPILSGSWHVPNTPTWAEVDAFIKELGDFRPTVVSHTSEWLRQDCILSYNPGYFSITCIDQELQKNLHQKIVARFGKPAKVNYLKVLSETQDEYDISNLASPGEPIIRENYSPEVVEDFDYLKREITAEKPTGRLGILSGEPGCGKTYLIRGLLHTDKHEDVDTDFVLTTVDQVIRLSQTLHKFAAVRSYLSKRTVLIIEDGDQALVKRDGHNISAIQAFLNFGAGLMGDALDVRLLVSTNAKTIEIDDAIKRPGRLIKHIEVGKLSAEHASNVFDRLVGNKVEGRLTHYTGMTSLAQVYEDATKFKKKAQVKRGAQA